MMYEWISYDHELLKAVFIVIVLYTSVIQQPGVCVMAAIVIRVHKRDIFRDRTVNSIVRYSITTILMTTQLWVLERAVLYGSL